MARQKGTANLAASLEVLAGAPLDAREKVATKADLTAANSFPYPYIGMETYVAAENKKYRLIGADPTDLENWQEAGSAHAGFTPVGTIISVMGNSAPQNYLACNGQTVNVVDYPELSAYFATQFGSNNYFGGDGTTTFGIPDLRGEFLRGTGTNSHANNGNGAAVGTHQDGTRYPAILVSTSGSTIVGWFMSDSKRSTWGNVDKALQGELKRLTVSGSLGSSTENNVTYQYSGRPTNTSVLYCIATKNIYVDARFDYSTDEKVVGTWIDGKPLYQKTFDCGSLPNNSDKTFSVDVPIAFVLNISGIAIQPSSTTILTLPQLAVNTTTSDMSGDIRLGFSTGTLKIHIRTYADRTAFTTTYVTLQYTKTTD